MRHLAADRANRQSREAARATGAYNQQVGVFRRLDELVGGHTADGLYGRLLLTVAGSRLLDEFLGGFPNLFLGLGGRVELSRDTPDAGSGRGDREDGHWGVPERGLIKGPVKRIHGVGGPVHSNHNARHLSSSSPGNLPL